MISASTVLVVLGYLGGITAFGIWVGRRDRSVTGFFLAGRSTPFWAVAACVVATETSVLTFTSIPGFAYEGDFGFLQLAAGFLLGRVGIALVLLPAYFRGEVVTTYELLLQRFGTRVRSAAAAIFLVYRNLADGVRLHAAALMVAIVAGVPEWWCIVALAAAMVAFSEEGGVKATIWTDVIQLGVYLIGAGVVVAALWQGSGPEPLAWIPAAREAGKFAVALPVLDLTIPYTLWAGVIGGFFLTFATHGADQYLAQRLLAARSLRHAQAGLVLSGVGALLQFGLFLGIGAWLWHYYGGREFARPDEVLPTFVAEHLSGAAAGITLAAVVAAALSPSLVSLASTTVRDFWLPWKQRGEAAAGGDDARQVRVGRQFVVVWGIVQTAVALVAQRAPSALEAGLSILSYASGPTVGAFLLAVLSRRAQPTAVLLGMAGGFAAPALVRLAGFPLAWTWDVMVGSLATFAVGLVLSRSGNRRP
jgi:SSS family transporter